MQIYSSTLKGPLKVPGYIDPEDVTSVSIFWGCETFQTNKVYRIGDVMRPTTDNGYYYQCNTNGTSGLTNPTWAQDEITTGDAIFTAVPWDLWLMPDQIITNSEWSSTANVTLSTDTYTNYSTSIIIESFDDTVTEFDITNQVTKSTGEKLSRTLKYKTNQQ